VQVYNFTLNGTAYENLTLDQAQAQLAKLVTSLNNRVTYYQGYQSEFGKVTNSFMNFVIGTASGFNYQPDAAIWGTLTGEINDASSSASSGSIPDAATKLTTAATDVATAVKAWNDYLDNFYGGGNNVISALGTVAQLSIGAEAVMITVATGGAGGAAASAAIGAGGSGLSDAVDQWVNINEGKQHDFNWKELGEKAVLGAVLGAAGGALGEKWAAMVAKYAPDVVGANTPLLEKIGQEFIDSNTGARLTAAEVAAKMEPLWGKVVTSLPGDAVKVAIEKMMAEDKGGDGEESFARGLAGEIGDSTWEELVKTALKDLGLALAE
jgi:hypothetical protein